MDSQTLDFISRHEGLRLTAYRDSRGILTVGIGTNLEAPGARQRLEAVEADYDAVCKGSPISVEQTKALLATDVQGVVTQLQGLLPHFNEFPAGVQLALTDMAYNLGITRLQGFHKALAALFCRDWATAADEFMDSLWAKQVGKRAAEDCDLIRAG